MLKTWQLLNILIIKVYYLYLFYRFLRFPECVFSATIYNNM